MRKIILLNKAAVNRQLTQAVFFCKILKSPFRQNMYHSTFMYIYMRVDINIIIRIGMNMKLRVLGDCAKVW